jgi:2,4-dienoyl-CoA reductase-like NADH-dependent reductase (Old Yellow Enzyme family)
LDAKFQIDPADTSVVWSDAELDDLIGDYVAAARVAEAVGYQFVDIKSCHGYLLHEFLSARSRPGPYGGDLAGRTRLLRSIIQAVRGACPTLMIGVRLSVTDTVPYRAGQEIGQPMDAGDAAYEFGFGLDPLQPDRPQLDEPFLLLGMLEELGVAAVNVSAGSPYYNPHILRPAIFPPSDGYLPPEDPLVGVARHLELTRRCKEAVPDLPLVGSGYTYLQEYLPQVAQATVRQGWTDFVGIGRMVLTYWELPADVLAGRKLARKRICRTFSDCTTGPRHGMISGCYPLDDYYKQLPEAARVQEIRQALRGR